MGDPLINVRGRCCKGRQHAGAREGAEGKQGCPTICRNPENCAVGAEGRSVALSVRSRQHRFRDAAKRVFPRLWMKIDRKPRSLISSRLLLLTLSANDKKGDAALVLLVIFHSPRLIACRRV